MMFLSKRRTTGLKKHGIHHDKHCLCCTVQTEYALFHWNQIKHQNLWMKGLMTGIHEPCWHTMSAFRGKKTSHYPKKTNIATLCGVFPIFLWIFDQGLSGLVGLDYPPSVSGPVDVIQPPPGPWPPPQPSARRHRSRVLRKRLPMPSKPGVVSLRMDGSSKSKLYRGMERPTIFRRFRYLSVSLGFSACFGCYLSHIPVPKYIWYTHEVQQFTPEKWWLEDDPFLLETANFQGGAVKLPGSSSWFPSFKTDVFL